MSAHGFGIGPAFGRAVANIVTERDVGHDLYRFRADRFVGCSQITRTGPMIIFPLGRENRSDGQKCTRTRYDTRQEQVEQRRNKM